MKTKLLVISFLITMFFMVGCGDQITNETYTEAVTDGRLIGSIHGVVTDGNTNARLNTIQVWWLADGQIDSTLTDILGYYSIPNLPPGSYEITFSGKNNYAINRVTVNVPTLQQIGIVDQPTEKDFYYSITQDMDLYKMNAALTGVVYTMQNDENINTASGVTVIADFSNYDISPDKYTVTTGGDGVFLFNNIPATQSVFLQTMPFNDSSYGYGVTTALVSLIPNGTANAGNIILTITPATPFIIQNNYENDDFGLTDDIVVTFSKAMDTSTFDILLESSNYGTVEFRATWNNDITLTIDPYVALQANELYFLSMSGKSQDNNSFTGNYEFQTQEGIEFVWTNLERVDGVFDQFPIDSNLEITFSKRVDLNNYNGDVKLYDQSFAAVSVESSLSADSTTVIINPLYNLEPGQDYILNYTVYSTIDGDFDSGTFNFQTAGDITPPDQVTGFVLDMGDGWFADWNTTLITFKWNTVANADGYIIYAKDSYNNSDLIQVASFDAQDYLTEQNETVDLRMYPQFDYYVDDGIQTPFTGDIEITFKILAYNYAGEGAFSSAIVVTDQTAPTGLITQDSSSNNFSTTDTKIFTITFLSNEYLDSTVPTYAFIENGGDRSYVLPSSAVTFKWDSGMMSGLFTITVPASKNGSGDNFVTIAFKDSSGNNLEQSILITLF